VVVKWWSKNAALRVPSREWGLDSSPQRNSLTAVPLESRLFVKTSLVALVLTFVWGGAMAIVESVGRSVAGMWAVEHAHLAFVGWLVNIVIGIALWMLPLDRERYPETAGRYPAGAPLLVYALLNGGLLLRMVCEPFLGTGLGARVGLLAGSIAQILAVLVFAGIAWHRVRAPARPAPGVR
jgi:hypothetical protein